MNFIKKGLITLGTTAALAGAFTATTSLEAEAAQWEARTVSEVTADIEKKDTEAQYTIQWGDTLGVIAAAFDVSLNEIVQINEIANKDFIMTGNVLSLSADNKTVSIQDKQTNEVKSYDISEPEVKEVEPVEEAPAKTAPAKPAQTKTSTIQAAPAEPAEATEAPETQATSSDSEAEAKAWIAFKESTDNYNARNGKYIGKYQLTNSYLNGDYSPANQERVADQYVASRYGSWTAAKNFWLQNGWY